MDVNQSCRQRLQCRMERKCACFLSCREGIHVVITMFIISISGIVLAIFSALRIVSGQLCVYSGHSIFGPESLFKPN